MCRETLYFSKFVLWEATVCQKSISCKQLKGVTDILNCFAPGWASTSTSSCNVLHIIYFADTLWALEMVKCKFLGQNSDNKFQIFKRIFLGSVIAKSSLMQRTTFAYTINFQLAQLFFLNWLRKFKNLFFYNFFWQKSWPLRIVQMVFYYKTFGIKKHKTFQLGIMTQSFYVIAMLKL